MEEEEEGKIGEKMKKEYRTMCVTKEEGGKQEMGKESGTGEEEE